MARVSIDDVRDVINVSSADVPDSKVLKMIKRAKEGKVKINEKQWKKTIVFELVKG